LKRESGEFTAHAGRHTLPTPRLAAEAQLANATREAPRARRGMASEAGRADATKGRQISNATAAISIRPAMISGKRVADHFLAAPLALNAVIGPFSTRFQAPHRSRFANV